MDLSLRIKVLKKEWKFFWNSFFELFGWMKNKFLMKEENKTRPKPESLPRLSLQRQRLHQRLEEIEKEAADLKVSRQDPNQLGLLHDEGQNISEKIESISQKISRARNTRKDIAL